MIEKIYDVVFGENTLTGKWTAECNELNLTMVGDEFLELMKIMSEKLTEMTKPVTLVPKVRLKISFSKDE